MIADRPSAANGWHALAQGLFTVGVYFGVTFGSLIVGRLMTEQRLSDAASDAPGVLWPAMTVAGLSFFVSGLYSRSKLSVLAPSRSGGS
jgi:hypothetical protein